MTLIEHEKRLLEDEDYRKQWTEQEILKSSQWFMEQIHSKYKAENK